jgi:hypothetical protein
MDFAVMNQSRSKSYARMVVSKIANVARIYIFGD